VDGGVIRSIIRKKPLWILSPPKHLKEVELIAAGKVVLLVIAALLPIVNPLSSARYFSP
jgi:hypothetical protein